MTENLDWLIEIPCRRCGVVKTFSEFYPSSLKNNQCWCKKCSLEYNRMYSKTHKRKKYHREYENNRYKIWKYGLSITDIKELAINQDNKCLICLKDFGKRGPQVDHVKDTKIIRGLLCWHCNTSIGKFYHNIDTIQRAARYLRKTDNKYRLNPFCVIEMFENEVAAYCGSKYAVAVDSCTNSIFLALRWFQYSKKLISTEISMPKYSYVSIPMQIIHAGFKVKFTDEIWEGMYQLKPLPIWDSARRFERNMYRPDTFMCTSHHYTKPLGIGRNGGCILHDCDAADEWLKRARFDGRTSGLAIKDDSFPILGYHFPMAPETAAAGLVRLSHLGDGYTLPNDKYPDLSKLKVFK